MVRNLDSSRDELKSFMEQTDAWVKNLSSRISDIEDAKDFIVYNTNNIQHNYELIYELKDAVENIINKQRMMELNVSYLIKNAQLINEIYNVIKNIKSKIERMEIKDGNVSMIKTNI